MGIYSNDIFPVGIADSEYFESTPAVIGGDNWKG